MPSLTKAEIEAAATRRVVFAHQSVGNNILGGAAKLAAEQGVKLNIVKTRTPSADAPGIYHFIVGQNGAPDRKISDYKDTLSPASFPGADIAMMKLCYVDFSATTDAVAVAKSYVAALEALQKAHPKTRFVAVTSPLTTVQGGLKGLAKWALGRPTGAQENARRHEFNEYLRKQFGPGHIFDIAKIESDATASGTPALRADLTDDGGHLNEAGQRLAGAAFLKLLAEAGQ
jgi:hypothetical protein